MTGARVTGHADSTHAQRPRPTPASAALGEPVLPSQRESPGLRDRSRAWALSWKPRGGHS